MPFFRRSRESIPDTPVESAVPLDPDADRVPVADQRELAAVVASGRVPVVSRGWFCVGAGVLVEARDTATVRAVADARVQAHDRAVVLMIGDVHLEAHDRAHFQLVESGTVVASGWARGKVRPASPGEEESWVAPRVTGRSRVSLSLADEASAETYGAASVTASGQASLTCHGNTGGPDDSVVVVGRDQALVSIDGPAQVDVGDEVLCTAYSGTVTAHGAAIVGVTRLYADLMPPPVIRAGEHVVVVLDSPQAGEPLPHVEAPTVVSVSEVTEARGWLRLWGIEPGADDRVELWAALHRRDGHLAHARTLDKRYPAPGDALPDHTYVAPRPHQVQHLHRSVLRPIRVSVPVSGLHARRWAYELGERTAEGAVMLG